MKSARILTYLAVACLILAGSILLKLAQHEGLIGPDAGGRWAQVVIGLSLAVYGNFIPKTLGASIRPEDLRRAQTARRISGWSFALAGLAYAGLWAFAPKTADSVGLWVIAAAVAITALAIWTCVRRSPGQSASLG